MEVAAAKWGFHVVDGSYIYQLYILTPHWVLNRAADMQNTQILALPAYAPNLSKRGSRSSLVKQSLANRIYQAWVTGVLDSRYLGRHGIVEIVFNMCVYKPHTVLHLKCASLLYECCHRDMEWRERSHHRRRRFLELAKFNYFHLLDDASFWKQR